MAPGGLICRIDPEGKDFELFAMGFRNAFDIAFIRTAISSRTTPTWSGT